MWIWRPASSPADSLTTGLQQAVGQKGLSLCFWSGTNEAHSVTVGTAGRRGVKSPSPPLPRESPNQKFIVLLLCKKTVLGNSCWIDEIKIYAPVWVVTGILLCRYCLYFCCHYNVNAFHNSHSCFDFLARVNLYAIVLSVIEVTLYKLLSQFLSCNMATIYNFYLYFSSLSCVSAIIIIVGICILCLSFSLHTICIVCMFSLCFNFMSSQYSIKKIYYNLLYHN